jgi:hypothetical protein
MTMLQLFDDRIWIADGPAADVAGFSYPTRMAVIRLPDGALFIWSPIALCNELRTALDALGEVRHIIAPNALHHLFTGDWQAAYPAAKLYAAPGLRGRRKDIVFDGDLGDAPSPAWSGEIDQVVVRGNAITSEVVFFHRQSRTVIFTDLVQHFAPGWFSGWRAVVARWDLMTAPEPTVPRKFRIAFLDRGAARVSLQRILAWPIEKVLMAHGAPIDADGHALIVRAFAWLT